MELWWRQAEGNAKHECTGKDSSYISKMSGCWLEKETDWKSWRTARRQKDHNCEEGKPEPGITARKRQNLWFYLVPTHLHASHRTHSNYLSQIPGTTLSTQLLVELYSEITVYKQVRVENIIFSSFLFRWIQMNKFLLIWPVGHIKGQCAAAQAWDHVATTKGEVVNFVRWYHSPLEQ